MFVCPTCGAETRNLETRTVEEDGRTYKRRRKACIKCPRRFTTSECLVDDGTSSNVMQIPTRTMEALLRLIVSAFSTGTPSRAQAVIDELLLRTATAAPRKLDEHEA